MEHSHLPELRHRGFTHYDTIDNALKKLFTAAKIQRLGTEEVPLIEAVNRVLGEDIRARRSLPPYDKSLVDGYALRSAESKGASKRHPVSFKIRMELRLGQSPRINLGKDECALVPTGGFLPAGADTVVMFEEVQVSRNRIKIPRRVLAGENTVRAGGDVKHGELLFKRGHILRWFELGLLAALHYRAVEVVRKPRVAVLSSGNELVEAGKEGTPDSNRPLLLAAVRSYGCEPVDLGIAKDNLKEILSALRRGLKSADMILVSGGSSVGEKDLVPEAVTRLGKPGLVVHGVAMRPGSPTGLGVVSGKPILILPGFPISALVGFYILGQRILARMLGTGKEHLSLSTVRGRLTEDIEAGGGMTSFRPVSVRARGSSLQVYPVKPYGSSIVSSIARADGIIMLEGKSHVKAGTMVEVSLMRPIRTDSEP